MNPGRHLGAQELKARGVALARRAASGEDERVSWIELDGAVNVRDLGALATDDGRVTASHRLLRGDNLQDLSPSDVRTLVADIGVTTVVDLRSPGR